jgi:hypothetical protein
MIVLVNLYLRLLSSSIIMNYAIVSIALLIVASGALLILSYWLFNNVKKSKIHQKLGLGQKIRKHQDNLGVIGKRL